MIDLKRTLMLVRGGFFDSQQMWRNYLPEADNWHKTVFLLTGPLIIAAALAAYVLGFLVSDTSFLGRFRPTIVSTILNVIMTAIAAAGVALVVSALAGAFGGKNSFARGLAATTFAFIPGYLGQALVWLPWIGGLLALGLFVYALILLWKIIPIYLDVPDEKRAGHYILSLLATFAVAFILSMTMGRLLIPSTGEPGASSSLNTGFLGSITGQAELIAAAEEDTFTPPSDGRLSEKQVREYLRVMKRTEELQQQKAKQLNELMEKTDKQEELSLRDLGRMMSGIGEVAGLQTLEIEVVKSAGGNWAEHQWVHQTLRTAWIQKDINDSVAHNYKLYQDHEKALSSYVTQ